jgi:predicted Zn-dependent protease
LAKDIDGALEISSRMLKLYPRYAPAIIGHANMLMAAGKPEDARQILLSHEQAQGTQLETYNLLAQAARESGNLAEASFQMATYLLLRGDAGMALAQLDAGLRLDNLSSHDRSRLVAKRKEARDTLPENWRMPDPRGR